MFYYIHVYIIATFHAKQKFNIKMKYSQNVKYKLNNPLWWRFLNVRKHRHCSHNIRWNDIETGFVAKLLMIMLYYINYLASRKFHSSIYNLYYFFLTICIHLWPIAFQSRCLPWIPVIHGAGVKTLFWS